MASTKVQIINGGFQDAEGNVLANGYLKMKLSQDEMASGVGQVAGGIEVQIPLDSNGNILGTPSPFTLSAVAVAAGVATYTGTITGGGNNAYNGISFVIAGFVQGGNNGTFVCTGSTTTTLTFAATTQVNETHAGTATGGTQNIWPNDQLTPTNSFYFVKGYKSNGQLAWGPNAQQVVGATPFDCNTWTPNFLPNFSPATTAISLQTNEVANGSQSLLDLHAGSNITLTDNGSGRVTIAGAAALTLQTNETPNGSQTLLDLHAGAGVTLTDNGSGRVTIVNTNPGATGAIALTSTPNTGGSGSTPINVSTEGALDWFVWATSTGISSGYSPTQTSVHSKVLGGWIANTLNPFGPQGSISALNNNTTPWTWTSTLGDDTVLSLATVNANFLNAVNISQGWQSNTATLIQGGFGFRFIVPAMTVTRNLNLYLFFKSGSVATNNSLVVKARLGDGSVADQTLTISPADTGSHYYKVNIQFNATANGVPLVVVVTASQATGDSFTELTIGAITMF